MGFFDSLLSGVGNLAGGVFNFLGNLFGAGTSSESSLERILSTTLGGIGAWQDYNQGKRAQDALKALSSGGAIDPYGDDRREPMQGALANMMLDPNFDASSIPGWGGMMGVADLSANTAMRQMAARGNFYSGGAPGILAKVYADHMIPFMENYRKDLLQTSGANFNPSGASALSALLASQAAGYGGISGIADLLRGLSGEGGGGAGGIGALTSLASPLLKALGIDTSSISSLLGLGGTGGAIEGAVNLGEAALPGDFITADPFSTGASSLNTAQTANSLYSLASPSSLLSASTPLLGFDAATAGAAGPLSNIAMAPGIEGGSTVFSNPALFESLTGGGAGGGSAAAAGGYQAGSGAPVANFASGSGAGGGVGATGGYQAGSGAPVSNFASGAGAAGGGALSVGALTGGPLTGGIAAEGAFTAAAPVAAPGLAGLAGPLGIAAAIIGLSQIGAGPYASKEAAKIQLERAVGKMNSGNWREPTQRQKDEGLPGPKQRELTRAWEGNHSSLAEYFSQGGKLSELNEETQAAVVNTLTGKYRANSTAIEALKQGGSMKYSQSQRGKAQQDAGTYTGTYHILDSSGNTVQSASEMGYVQALQKGNRQPPTREELRRIRSSDRGGK